jgi:hypothetical protein
MLVKAQRIGLGIKLLNLRKEVLLEVEVLLTEVGTPIFKELSQAPRDPVPSINGVHPYHGLRGQLVPLGGN